MRTGAAAPVRNSGVEKRIGRRKKILPSSLRTCAHAGVAISGAEIRIGRRKAALSASSARCLGMTHLFAAILISAKGNMPQNVYKIRKSVQFYRFLCFLIDFLPKHPYNGAARRNNHIRQPCPEFRRALNGNTVKIRGSPLYCEGDASANTPLLLRGREGGKSGRP